MLQAEIRVIEREGYLKVRVSYYSCGQIVNTTGIRIDGSPEDSFAKAHICAERQRTALRTLGIPEIARR